MTEIDDMSCVQRLALVQEFCREAIQRADELDAIMDPETEKGVAAVIAADITRTFATIVDRLAAGDVLGVADFIAALNEPR